MLFLVFIRLTGRGHRGLSRLVSFGAWCVDINGLRCERRRLSLYARHGQEKFEFSRYIREQEMALWVCGGALGNSSIFASPLTSTPAATTAILGYTDRHVTWGSCHCRVAFSFRLVRSFTQVFLFFHCVKLMQVVLEAHLFLKHLKISYPIPSSTIYSTVFHPSPFHAFTAVSMCSRGMRI